MRAAFAPCSLLMMSILVVQEQMEHGEATGSSSDEETDETLQSERRKRKNDSEDGDSRSGRPKFGGSR